MFGTRRDVDVFFRIFHQRDIVFDVERLTCNVTSSMSLGSTLVSSVSSSSASSRSELVITARTSVQVTMLCALFGSQRLGLHTQILVLRLTEDDVSVRVFWLVDVGLVDCEENVLVLHCHRK